MTTRDRLLSTHIELTKAIRASETFEQSYKASPTTFKRLLDQEARLQAAANDYLIGLSTRIPSLVDWSQVNLQPIMAAAVPAKGSEEFKREEALLLQAVYDYVLELIIIGGNAGEDIYSRPLGFTNLSEYVIEAAGKHSAGLVSQVNDTTRSGIQQAIKQSIDLGEDREAAIARVQKLVANPVRAEMIAQTESVNSYQIGLDLFADGSGAISSTWDALSGACQLCAPLDGVTKKIGEYFQLPNGTEVLRPAAHVRCRCGRILNYPE